MEVTLASITIQFLILESNAKYYYFQPEEDSRSDLDVSSTQEVGSSSRKSKLSVQPGSVDGINKGMEEWCFESCIDLPAYNIVENSGADLANGDAVSLQGSTGKSCIL